MQRRKWWYIALSLAFLTACVGVWRWSGRPRFGFLERVQAGPLSIGLDGTCAETYFSPSAASELEKAAKRELLASGWQPSAEGRSWQAPDQAATLIFLQTGRYHYYYAANPAPAFPKTMPSGTVCVIRIARKATALDRARVWMQKVFG